MIYPSADTIEDKIGSRYSLVVLAAKRAKQIKEGAPILIETLSTNPLTIALEEIAAGKVTAQEDSAAMQAHTANPHVSETPAASPLLPAATRPLAINDLPSDDSDLSMDDDDSADDLDSTADGHDEADE